MMGLWECMWTLDVYLQMMMRGKCISVFDVDQCVHNSARVLRLTSFLSLLKPTQSPRVSFTNSKSRSWVSWWATVCRSISFPSMMKPWPRSTLPWTWVTKCEGVFQKRVLLCVVYLCVCVCVFDERFVVRLQISFILICLFLGSSSFRCCWEYRGGEHWEQNGESETVPVGCCAGWVMSQTHKTSSSHHTVTSSSWSQFLFPSRAHWSLPVRCL